MVDLQRLTRSAIKSVLGLMLRWKALPEPVPGYTIVLGVPFALRHLLTVNLDFVRKCTRDGLDRIQIVFDRREQAEGAAFIDSIRNGYGDLPLAFQFHPPRAGALVARVNRSKFYASLNWVTGLAECRTRYAVLHDFDLYPLDGDYFEKIHRAMRDGELRFSGAEYTHFDGLTDDDGLIGTWSLGIDAAWIRENFRPIECFHEVMPVNDRRVDLDAFSAIQASTPRRALAPDVGPGSYVHVRNLVSTYLLFSDGRQARIAWRLHHLWYLESLAAPARDLDVVSEAMDASDGPTIEVDGHVVDLSGVHHTCANVLEREVLRTEEALFGELRPEIRRYLDSFAGYLERKRQLLDAGEIA